MRTGAVQARWRFGGLAILLGALLLPWATNDGAAEGRLQVIEAEAFLATDGAHPGAAVKAAVAARIAPGFHVNSHTPNEEYLIPTELKLEPSANVSVERVVYPKGVLKTFAFSEKPLSVYEGEFVVGALLKTLRAIAAGNYELKGKLAYQACNNSACLPPTSVPVTLSLKVVRRTVPLKSVRPDVFKKIQYE